MSRIRRSSIRLISLLAEDPEPAISKYRLEAALILRDFERQRGSMRERRRLWRRVLH